MLDDFFAFEPDFPGGVRVALGDVNGDGISDIIAGAGPGGGPRVQVRNGQNGTVLQDFFAFEPIFSGGVYVAAGDINHAGYDDIIVAADAGGGPRVEAFDGRTGAALHNFFAYEPGFTGGVRLAAGDINGDGYADIITAAGPGGGPRVQVFDGRTLQTLSNFFAYDPSFSFGISVAAGDVNGDGQTDLITGAGPSGGPHVKVIDGRKLGLVQPTGVIDDAALLASFFAYDLSVTSGVRVGTVDFGADGQVDLVTGPGPGAPPHVRVWNGQTQAVLDEFFAFDDGSGRYFTGGIFVAGR